MSDIKVFVDDDMINNPFWEVRLTMDDCDESYLETRVAIDLATKAQKKVDKVVICRGITPTEVIFKKCQNGSWGWERIHFKSRAKLWFPSEELEGLTESIS